MYSNEGVPDLRMDYLGNGCRPNWWLLLWRDQNLVAICSEKEKLHPIFIFYFTKSSLG